MEFSYYNSFEDLDNQYIEDNMFSFREIYEKIIDQLPSNTRTLENISLLVSVVFFSLDQIEDLDKMEFPISYAPEKEEIIVDFASKLHILIVLFYMEDAGEIIYNKDTGKFIKKD